MESTSFDFFSLLIVAVAAVAAPMLAQLVPRGLLAPVVLEVVAGIVLGPQGLGWIDLDIPTRVISLMGLGFLLFLAGMELTPATLVSRSARAGLVAYVVAVALSFPAALVLRALGASGDLRILALAVTSTSLGVLVPVLRDAGESGTSYGQSVFAAASIGEFAGLLLLTVLFSADPKSTPVQILFVAGLAVSSVVAIAAIRWCWSSRWFADSLDRMDDTTSQLRVRTALLLLLFFSALVSSFGLSSILGAFVAGVVVRVASRDIPAVAEERYTAKLGAIGFGFLIPVFFITTGAGLDIRNVLSHPRTLALVPLFLLSMVVVRGASAALLLRRGMTSRGAVANGALQATSLTFPIVVSTIGLSLGFLSRATAAALVTAGLLSVVVLPAIALSLRPWTSQRESPAGEASPAGAN